MKVVHLLHRAEVRGNGIVDATVDLALHQARAGHEVAVISGGGEYCELLNRHGVEHVTIDLHARRARALREVARGLRSTLVAMDPDVVHAHTPTTLLLARLTAGRRFPLVTTAHNEFDGAALALNLADRIIAVSSANAASRKFRTSRVTVVRNGVVGSLRPRPPLTVALARPSLVFVGGVSKRKGVSRLIDAHEVLSRSGVHAHLHIVGDGPQRAEYEARAQRSSASDTVTFHGFQRNTRAFIDQADLFVLPSVDEPFGLVLAEAREAGCAIIASDVGGIPEVLEHGRAGVLVDATSAQDLARAIATLLPDERARVALGRAARENLDWLSIDRVTGETDAVYTSVIRGRPARRRR